MLKATLSVSTRNLAKLREQSQTEMTSFTPLQKSKQASPMHAMGIKRKQVDVPSQIKVPQVDTVLGQLF